MNEAGSVSGPERNLEQAPEQEASGQVYETMEELNQVIKTKNSGTLRLWGVTLVKIEGKTRQQIQDSDDPKSFVDGRIHKVDPAGINLNFPDFSKLDDRGRPILASWGRITNKDVNTFRIQVMSESEWQQDMAQRYPKLFKR